MNQMQQEWGAQGNFYAPQEDRINFQAVNIYIHICIYANFIRCIMFVLLPPQSDGGCDGITSCSQSDFYEDSTTTGGAWEVCSGVGSGGEEEAGEARRYTERHALASDTHSPQHHHKTKRKRNRHRRHSKVRTAIANLLYIEYHFEMPFLTNELVIQL